MKKTLPGVLLILYCFSCMKDDVQDLTKPCYANCEITLEHIWRTPLLDKEFMALFSPVIQGDNVFFGTTTYSKGSTIWAIDKFSGKVNWTYEYGNEVSIWKHRFYDGYLALYTFEGGDFTLSVIDLTSGKEVRRKAMPKGKYIKLSFQEKNIFYPQQGKDKVDFYRIPIDSLQHDVFIMSISDPKTLNNVIFYKSQLLFNYRGNNSTFFLSYNSFSNTLYAYDLKKKKMTTYQPLKTFNSYSPDPELFTFNSYVYFFDKSRMVIVIPGIPGLYRSAPVSYRATSSQVPFQDRSYIYLNTLNPQDIVAIIPNEMKIEYRYTNMGECNQIRKVEGGLLVTCEGEIYLLKEENDYWIWRDDNSSDGSDYYSRQITVTPAVDPTTRNLYYIQGANFICSAWPDV